MRRKRIFTRSILCSFFLIAFLSQPLDANPSAQRDEGLWSVPELLFESSAETLVDFPFIISDQSGKIHSFWTHYDENISSNKQLFYSRWAGQNWTIPVDIIASPIIRSPKAVVDIDGYIHLVWQGNSNRLFYSRSFIGDATSAHGWSEPLSVAEANLGADIVVDSTGKLHLLYAGIGTVGVYYQSSDNNGLTWSPRASVALTARSNTAAGEVNIALGMEDKIHVVWTEYQLPNGWPPTGVYYSRSSDGGDTWEPPRVVASEGYNDINVVAAKREVHLAWNAFAGMEGIDVRGGRYHIWSADEGETWSTQITITDCGFSEGPPQIVVDSASTLHFLTTCGQRVWYAFWNEGQWSELDYVPTGAEREIPPLGISIHPQRTRMIETPTMTLSQGNHLNLMFYDRRVKNNLIWYVTKTVAAPTVAPVPFPAIPADSPAIVQPTNVSSQSDNSHNSPVSASASLVDLNQENMSLMSNPATPIIVAALPVILILVSVFFVQTIVRQRKQ